MKNASKNPRRTRGSDDVELYHRAVAAMYRTDDIPQQPAAAASGVEEHSGKSYVVLRNINGVIACYLLNKGKLRRAIAPPGCE